MPAGRQTPLVTSDWLEARLDDPAVRVIEISLEDSPATFESGHIPGAIWSYWKDLCWDESDRQFLTPAQLADRLGQQGIGEDSTVVLSGDPVQFGTYAYWALLMAGHRDLRLLDGARTRWTAEGRPLTAEPTAVTPVLYQPQAADQSMRAGRDEVVGGLGDPGRLLLDVRSPEEYRGERVMPPPEFDHGAERKGRIPGARHLYYRELLNDDDTFKSPAELRAVLAASAIDPGDFEDVVAYCRLSHRATLVWTALHYLLGFDHVRIYDGSWTEWGSMVGMPVET
ncbi:MAG: sulfurtransferase [Acidimicrobiia bacterium]